VCVSEKKTGLPANKLCFCYYGSLSVWVRSGRLSCRFKTVSVSRQIVGLTRQSRGSPKAAPPYFYVRDCYHMPQPHEVTEAWHRKQFRTPAIRRTGLPVSAYGPAVAWPCGGWSGSSLGNCATLRYGHPLNCTDPNLRPTNPRLKERSDSRSIWSTPNGSADSESEGLVCTTCCHRAPRCRNHQALHLAAIAGADVWPRRLSSKTAISNFTVKGMRSSFAFAYPLPPR
jgi:hypothetical protein